MFIMILAHFSCKKKTLKWVPDWKQESMLTFSGSWEKISAGGSLKYASWRYNPQLFLRTPNPCKVKITLQQEHEKEVRATQV